MMNWEELSPSLGELLALQAKLEATLACLTGSDKSAALSEPFTLSSVLQTMRRFLLLLCLPLLANAADLSGTWHLHVLRFGEMSSATRIEFNVDAANIAGTWNENKITGTVSGDDVRIAALRDGKEFLQLEGRVVGEEIKGTGKQGDYTFDFDMKRAPVVSGPAKTHNFVPTVFQRAFSGLIPPVLHIQPGDTVKTMTVDAGGRDSKGVRRSMGGNPETGPFFIEGAMPGDTVVVKLLRLKLNRDSAGSGDRIVPNALQASYYRNAKFDDSFDSEWKLDAATGMARLAKPSERLKNFQVAMRPMLGCIGVAPPQKQSLRAGYLGSWGGNMDYSGVREGVTVYLPVYQEGAILFLGDGHALEGDGELNGDALETSMDVDFQVDLVKGFSSNAPRFENAEYIMASGIGNSLQDALQQATTELASWLERDYKLNANESNIVLGTSIRYDIAEVVDPLMHVVAKIDKSVLATLK